MAVITPASPTRPQTVTHPGTNWVVSQTANLYTCTSVPIPSLTSFEDMGVQNFLKWELLIPQTPLAENFM